MTAPKARRGAVIGLRGLLSCLCVVSPSMAAEALDEDLMYDIDDLHAAIKSAVAGQDAPRATADAKALRALFAAVQRHYAQAGDADDAVGLARQGQSLAEQIALSATAGQWPQALKASQDLSGTCKSCHAHYKP